jgi:hypothetical protein
MSQEQLDIVEAIKTNNVIIDCVVGSGKTSTVLLIAKHNPDKQVLMLTYNKRLRLETMDKSNDLKNLEIHTFHSYYVKYYDKNCHTDTSLLGLLNTIGPSGTLGSSILTKKKVKSSTGCPLRKYDIIIIDEAQDLNNIYFRASLNIINETLNENGRIAIIGDQRQCIYEYNGSDSRYITYADTLFGNGNGNGNVQWKHMKLTKSFRITKQMCNFIANNLSGPVVKSDKNGQKIRYIICNQYSSRPYEEVLYYMSCGFEHDSIFVLAPSIKNSGTPVRNLVNKLSAKGIPVYCPLSDNEKLDSDITEGKLVFCTFHQSKGLERPVVIVFNFDDSYTKFYNKQAIGVLNNELYVALTRSSQRLSLLHHNTNNFLSFMTIGKTLYESCTVEGLEKLKPKVVKEAKTDYMKSYCVTELLKHVPSKIVIELLALLEISVINMSEERIAMPIKVPQTFNGYKVFENVSEINGVAIPAYYEYITTGNLSIATEAEAKPESKTSKTNNKTDNKTEKAVAATKTAKTSTTVSKESKSKKLIFRDDSDDSDCEEEESEGYKESEKESVMVLSKKMSNISPSELLFLSNKWLSKNNGFTHKMNQITEYNWLTEEILNKCSKRLNQWIPKDAVYEVPYNKVFDNVAISGFIDCIFNNSIFEFKCVDTIDPIYYIQLSLYAYLAGLECTYNLLNITDNSCYRVYASEEAQLQIIKTLVAHKQNSNNKTDDDTFLKNNNQ